MGAARVRPRGPRHRHHPGGRPLPRHAAVFAAGGPIANLLVALLARMSLATSPSPATPASAMWLAILGHCVSMGLFLGLLNLVPLPRAGSDGARVLQALRSPG